MVIVAKLVVSTYSWFPAGSDLLSQLRAVDLELAVQSYHGIFQGLRGISDCCLVHTYSLRLGLGFTNK